MTGWGGKVIESIKANVETDVTFFFILTCVSYLVAGIHHAEPVLETIEYRDICLHKWHFSGEQLCDSSTERELYLNLSQNRIRINYNTIIQSQMGYRMLYTVSVSLTSCWCNLLCAACCGFRRPGNQNPTQLWPAWLHCAAELIAAACDL